MIAVFDFIPCIPFIPVKLPLRLCLLNHAFSALICVQIWFSNRNHYITGIKGINGMRSQNPNRFFCFETFKRDFLLKALKAHILCYSVEQLAKNQFPLFCHPERSEGSASEVLKTDPSLCSGWQIERFARASVNSISRCISPCNIYEHNIFRWHILSKHWQFFATKFVNI